MRLTNKVIIITGSTTGIGEAIARRCAAEGARVLIHGLEPGLGEIVAADLNAPLVNGQVVLAYVQAKYLIYLGQRLKRPILLKPWSSG